MAWLYEEVYSIAEDTASGSVSFRSLNEALSAVLGAELSEVLIDHEADQIRIRLGSAGPSIEDLDAIDEVLAAHTGDPVAPLAIAQITGLDHRDHRQIDYKTGLLDRLHKYVAYADPTAWKRGEYRRVEYYLTPTMATKVLEVAIEYARQPNGLLTMINPGAQWGDPDFFGRRTVRTWYRDDGTPHPATKITIKTYDGVEAAREGERRRGNVMKQLTHDVLLMLIYTETGGDYVQAEVLGMAFLAKYEDQVSLYEQTGSQSLRDQVAAATETWLDNDLGDPPFNNPGVTIRDVIMDSLLEITAP